MAEWAHYHASFWGLWLIICTVMAQGMVAAIAHRRQARYVPGVIDSSLGHDSFVFRSHRTFQNSLENLPLMFASIVLALWCGVAADWLAGCVWVYALARLLHMALYYAIATEQNPSPRSYFFAIGLVSNLVLLGLIAARLAG